ncbi:hypothetical protein OESDEN_01616 [Oesophagostomum dentatum]|uniref:Triacylglycerol lipase n=1 Tax=Oesophagostomum dentatum TaxID=61180 RepID=A0A0B1TLG3_OESDE|nr:hypothetical protein OESDEN_01616 [Oesophagostomum dentatum]
MANAVSHVPIKEFYRADDRLYYKRLPSRPTESESKTSIAEDYKAYLQYYSTESLPIGFPFKCWKLKTLLITFFSLLILFFIYARYKARYKLELEERIAMKTLGGILNCDPEVMKPSSSVPADVNKVRPADIKAIAAMGDSITVASLSKNYEDEREWEIYPGNSYAMGGDGPLKQQISTGKILREFNSKLVGLSHGKGYDDTVFNVAVGGMTSEDLPRQARELISRMKSKKVRELAAFQMRDFAKRHKEESW